MKITKEDFDQWRDSPATEEVFRALGLLADRTRDAWMTASWGKGNNDPLLLADLRARAEVVKDLTELTFEELEAALHEPERNLSDRIQDSGEAEEGQ